VRGQRLSSPVPATSARPLHAASLPDGLYPALIAAEQHTDDAAYEPQRLRTGPGYTANSRSHHLHIQFSPSGVRIGSGDPARSIGLVLEAYGTPARSAPVRPSAPILEGRRVVYRRAALDEWYVNGPAGLEQGFTLRVPPSGAVMGRVTLSIRLEGALQPALDHGDLVLRAAGQPTLRYGQVYAWDRTGRHLEAHLALAHGGTQLQLQVNARHALYPVTIDPLIAPTAMLSKPDLSTFDAFGESVAVSADGTVALVGADEVNGGAGAAYVFERVGSSWSSSAAPVAVLGAANTTHASNFGEAVALSSDGATALIGAPGANQGSGGAYIFVRPAAGWTSTGVPTSTLPSGDPNSQFGGTVALSGDGSTALEGSNASPAEAPRSVYLITRPAGGWSAPAPVSAVLTPPVSIQSLQFGWSVALSHDGETALIGAPDVNAAYVYAMPAGGWSTVAPTAATLSVTGEHGCGLKVALSGDATTALVSAAGAIPGYGAAYVFARDGSAWSDQSAPAAILQGGTVQTGALHYNALALSADGSVALIGATSETTSAEFAFIFVRPGTGWTGGATNTITAPTATLDNGGLAAGSEFGWAVALSGDGNTAVVGAFRAAANTGAVQVFAPAYPLSGTAHILVATGWSLFTLPLAPAAAVHASDVLSSILATTHGNLAALYGLSQGSWNPSLVDDGGSLQGQDFPLAPGDGYLLYSDHAGSFSEQSSALLTGQHWSIGAGWNLEGVPVSDGAMPSASAVLRALLANTRGSVVALYGLSNGRWSAGLVDIRGTITGQDFALQQGDAYLVYSDGAGTVQLDAAAAHRTMRPSGGLAVAALRAWLHLQPPAVP
jgi:hypothetical protein